VHYILREMDRIKTPNGRAVEGTVSYNRQLDCAQQELLGVWEEKGGLIAHTCTVYILVLVLSFSNSPTSKEQNVSC